MLVHVHIRFMSCMQLSCLCVWLWYFSVGCWRNRRFNFKRRYYTPRRTSSIRILCMCMT